MRPYILPTFLIIAEILYFIYILAKEHNEDFRNYIQKMKISILEKTKLNLNSEMKDVSRKSYILLLVVFIFTFFLESIG